MEDNETSKRRLYEFTALIGVGIVVAAHSEAEAELEVKRLSVDGLAKNSDRRGVVDGSIELIDVRESKAVDLGDEAHLVV